MHEQMRFHIWASALECRLQLWSLLEMCDDLWPCISFPTLLNSKRPPWGFQEQPDHSVCNLAYCREIGQSLQSLPLIFSESMLLVWGVFDTDAWPCSSGSWFGGRK
jgi:hypothetical protein